MKDTKRTEKTDRGRPDPLEYWAIILKRKWAILAFAIPFMASVALYVFLVKPTYTAKGTLLIEKESTLLTFDQILQRDPLTDEYYQTQYKLLQSRALANATIDKLKLYENKRFAGKIKSPAGGMDKPGSVSRRMLTDLFLGRLEVSPVRLTRLVMVRFKDQDPDFAAKTLNALFESFIDMNIRAKYQTNEQASEFLAAQITKLQNEIDEKQRKLQNYGAEKNIVSLNETETTVVQNLGEFNRALTAAQIDRVQKETYYSMIKGVSPESIPEAITNPLIQRLREDYGKLSREYAIMEERFGPEYPEMQRVKTELENARASLINELDNLQKAASSDWLAAVRKEQSLEEIFNKQKQESFRLNSNSILYNSLKIEIENKKTVLEALQKRQNETGVSADLSGLGTSNIRIVDRAEPPLYPSSPKKKIALALALLVGLIGGTGLAFFLEHLDNSVRNFADIESDTGWPFLGAVPAFAPDGNGLGREEKRADQGPDSEAKAKKTDRKSIDLSSWISRVKREIGVASPADRNSAAGPSPTRDASEVNGESIELVTFISPASGLAESYRTIRTSLLLSSSSPNPRCIACSSALPQEGKTTAVSNLAVTLSQTGKRVLIVDSDMRRPRQHKIFKLLNVKGGLSGYLAGTMDMEGLIKPTSVQNLFLINAGPIPPNPLELLGSDRMTALIDDLRRQFDYVLFDTPPILAVTDGLVLGTKVDSMILVAWAERTPREALKRVKEKLDMAGIRMLGVILNNLAIRKHDYYHRQQYYQYYGEKGNGDRTLRS